MNSNYKIFLNKKNSEITKLDIQMKSALNTNKVELHPYFEKFLFNSSKRLRPLFIFLLCDFLQVEIDDEIIAFASAIEFLHSASLIHDDILDDGEIRRNMKCLHLEKGAKSAVLAGDYLMFQAFNQISKIKNIELYNLLSDAAYTMTKSEIKALYNRYKKIELEEYIQTSKDKTASLFTACAKGVGIIKNIEIGDDVLNFSENFALCFQIKDDINNYLNKDKNKISSDEKCGIATLPFILNSCDIMDEANKYLVSELEKTKSYIQNKKNKNVLLPLVELLYEE